tara:strand:+ start:4048 stop:4350 length:303 start_codon:yes stop_codon:yes gene_type:complete
MQPEVSSDNKVKDYSGSPHWEECRKVYSRSQQDFPEALGMWRVLQLKRSFIGRTPLIQTSPNKFQQLIDKIIRQYKVLKSKYDHGQKIPPDITREEYAKL